MGDITLLLQQARSGDDAAWQRVVALLYDDLLRLARGASASCRQGTLNATALVHECYLRLSRKGADAVGSRAHFLALAGRAMRQILVNHARDRCAGKRGGGAAHTTLDHLDLATNQEAGDLLGLDAAMHQLAREDERLAQVVDCRVFAGLTEAETAEALDLSLRTTQRLWLQARERLQAYFTPAET
jgi:RNA polymerase sigma factor (TIGR02999 family)